MDNPKDENRKNLEKTEKEILQIQIEEKLNKSNNQNNNTNINHNVSQNSVSFNGQNNLNNTDFHTQIEPSKPPSADPSESIIYDQILDEYGYGWEIWKVIIGVVCVYTVDSYFVNFFPYMVTSYRNLYKLTDNQISFIGLIFFIAKMIGCILTGFLTTKCSRESYLKFCVFFLFLLNIGLGLIENLWFFYFMRVISALMSGFLEVIANNFLCEFLPKYLRSFTLNSSYVGFSLACVFINIIQLFTMPNFEASGIANTHLYYIGVNFVCMCLIYLWITDSPRNLILHGYEDQAFKILLKLKKGDQSYFTPEIKQQIMREIREGANAEDKNSSFFEVFTKNEYMTFTICLVIAAFSTDVLLDGGKLVNNLVLEKIDIENKKTDYHAIMMQNLIISLTNPISCFIFGYLTEVKDLGRKITIFIGVFLMGVVLMPGLFYPNQVALCFILFSFLNNVNNVIFTYSSEFYPTRIRDRALGWINFFGYAGSASSQYFLVLPMRIHWKATIILMIAIAFFCSIVICLNPYETYGHNLDIDSSKLEKIENYKTANDDEKQKLVHN